jgi:hypothetical protein
VGLTQMETRCWCGLWVELGIDRWDGTALGWGGAEGWPSKASGGLGRRRQLVGRSMRMHTWMSPRGVEGENRGLWNLRRQRGTGCWQGGSGPGGLGDGGAWGWAAWPTPSAPPTWSASDALFILCKYSLLNSSPGVSWDAFCT